MERLQYNVPKDYGELAMICGSMTFIKTYGSYYIEGEGFVRARRPYKEGGHICTIYYAINNKKRLYMIPIDSKNTKDGSCQYCNIDNLIDVFSNIYNMLQVKDARYKEELLISLARYYNPDTDLNAIDTIIVQDQETSTKLITNIFNEKERELRLNTDYSLFRLKPRAEL